MKLALWSWDANPIMHANLGYLHFKDFGLLAVLGNDDEPEHP